MECPKCGYEQTETDTCIECGVIFSRYYEIKQRNEQNRQLQKESAADSSLPPDFPKPTEPAATQVFPLAETSGLLGRIMEIRRQAWKPVSTGSLTSLSIIFGVLVYALATHSVMASSQDSFVLYLLHEANLAFHEAGHVIFGFFGRTIQILGGSLGQLLIPLIVSIHFWTCRDTHGFAFGMFWFFENFLDVAHYMADARALVLPLIGGLGAEAHDWRNLFLEWGLLRQDTVIASWTRTLGWVGMVCIWSWLVWRWYSGRETSES